VQCFEHSSEQADERLQEYHETGKSWSSLERTFGINENIGDTLDITYPAVAFLWQQPA
jgi:hypothetical protein